MAYDLSPTPTPPDRPRRSTRQMKIAMMIGAAGPPRGRLPPRRSARGTPTFRVMMVRMTTAPSRLPRKRSSCAATRPRSRSRPRPCRRRTRCRTTSSQRSRPTSRRRQRPRRPRFRRWPWLLRRPCRRRLPYLRRRSRCPWLRRRSRRLRRLRLASRRRERCRWGLPSRRADEAPK